MAAFCDLSLPWSEDKKLLQERLRMAIKRNRSSNVHYPSSAHMRIMLLTLIELNWVPIFSVLPDYRPLFYMMMMIDAAEPDSLRLRLMPRIYDFRLGNNVLVT